jgi:chromosome condensin MukBEF complex kleisin-like MukF subunit
MVVSSRALSVDENMQSEVEELLLNEKWQADISQCKSLRSKIESLLIK